MIRKVFISSTQDLERHRENTRDAVLRSELHPVMMEYFAPNGAALPLEECLTKVRESDVLVVLVAHRYGWVPPDQAGNEYKSITWLECKEAVDCHKEVLAFLVDDNYQWPEDQKELFNLVTAARGDVLNQEVVDKVQKNYQGLIRFKGWLSGRGIRATFTTPEDLAVKVMQALADWRRRIGSKTKRPGAKRQGLDSEALAFRNAHRSRLTDLLCIYYKHVGCADDVLIAPDGMPVLSQRNLIPEQPLPLSRLDDRLDLTRTYAPLRPESEDSAMLSLLQSDRAGPGLFNGLLFRFLGLDSKKRFKFCLGYYFDFLNTCEVLGHEFARAVLQNRQLRTTCESDSPFQDSDVLPLLKRPDQLSVRSRTRPTEFESRCTAFGSCALVVLKRTNQCPQMILNARSAELAETSGLLHVIPAGTFQPTLQDDRFLDDDFSLTENLVREFAEELFDDAGISGRETRKGFFGALDDLYGPRGKDFRMRIVHQRKYKLLYLGTVIDPLNLKPEILTVFMLHEGYLQAVSGQQLTPSWETDAGKISLVEFTQDRLDSVISNPELVPTGKAHLMLVKKHFQKLSVELETI
jgi:hypothetical protein